MDTSPLPRTRRRRRLHLLSFAALVLLTSAPNPAGEMRATPAMGDSPAPAEDAARIRTLVQNLGSASSAVRDRAESDLVAIGVAAIRALEEAATSSRAERSEGARRALEAILASCVQLVDAIGEPIEEGRIELWVPPSELVPVPEFSREPAVVLPSEPIVASSGPRGYFVRPVSIEAMERAERVVVSHSEYGRALVRFRSERARHVLRVPLVRRGTTAGERAATGVVFDPEEKPVGDAEVRCREVRTPGEGLVQNDDAGAVLTNDDGSFAIYLPDTDPNGERGEILPEGSRFIVTIEPPAGSDLFPRRFACRNTARATIALERPERFTVLEFESPAGGSFSAVEDLRAITLVRRDDDGGILALGSRFAEAGGGKLPAGIYEASFRGAAYLPIEIGASGPASVRFLFPPPRKLRGRVLEAATGAPVAGALIVGTTGIRGGNLARLEPGDWKRIHALRVHPSTNDPALEPVAREFSLGAVARTDEGGMYEITESRSERESPGSAPGELYEIIAIDEGFLPFRRRIHDFESGPDGVFRVPDLTLFPAARVLVRPVMTGEDTAVSVNPRWRFEPPPSNPSNEEEPAWVGELRKYEGPWESPGIAYASWLERNELQPVFVPAGVPFRFEIESPYADEWAPSKSPETFELARSTTRRIGDLSLERAMEVAVRVVGPDGGPLEGVPLRRRVDGSDAWSVAHNSDAEGRASFYVPRGRTTRFRVSDLPGDDGPAENLTTRIDVKDDPELPLEEVVIRLTQAQVELLPGARP